MNTIGSWAVISGIVAAIAVSAACSSSPSGGAEAVGELSAAVSQVPAGMQCLQLSVSGGYSTAKTFPVKPGQSTVLTVGGLPTGQDVITAQGFSVACSSVNSSALPDWVSDPVTATLVAGKPVTITLNMHGNGSVAATVDFPDAGEASAPLAIESLNPQNAAFGVPRSTTVDVTFSGPIDPTSVTAASLQVLLGASSVPGSLAFDNGNTRLSFQPAAPLALLTNYTGDLAGGITDPAGNPLASGATWSFTTGDGLWTPFSTRSNATGSAATEQIAADRQGNFLLLWQESALTGSGSSIWVARLDPAGGWSGPFKLSGAANAWGPTLAMDPTTGNAVAAWVVTNPDGSVTPWADLYAPATGFASPVVIGKNAPTWDGALQAAMDGSGNALVLWADIDSVLSKQQPNIWAVRYDATSGWGTPSILVPDVETDAQGASPALQLAFDTAGNAVAVWQERDPSNPNGQMRIRASIYAPGLGWGMPVDLASGGPGASSPSVGLDGSGNAIAVWVEYDGTNYSVWYSRYSAGFWEAGGALFNGAGSVETPQIAVAAGGNALVTWGEPGNVWGDRYDPTAGWLGASALWAGPVGGTAQIALDRSGNALVAWPDVFTGQSSNDILAVRYSSETGWAAPVTLTASSQTTTRSSGIQLAVDGSGEVTAAWLQNSSGQSALVTTTLR